MKAEALRGEWEIDRLSARAIENLNLKRNQEKDHWMCLSRKRLFWLLILEFIELICAVYSLVRLEATYRRALVYWGDSGAHIEELRVQIDSAKEHVRHEGGDVVCFVMMIVDNSGGLK